MECINGILKTLSGGTSPDIKNLKLNPNLTAKILEFFELDKTVKLTLDVRNLNNDYINAKAVSRSNNEYQIIFNSIYVKNATDLSIARTFIHEIMHVYLYKKFDRMEETEYSDLLKILKQSKSSSEGFMHHSYFADNLIPIIADNLYEWCRQSSLFVSYDYCKKMAWSGLAGIPEFENHPDKSQINRINNNEKTNNYAAKGRNCNQTFVGF